MLHVMYPKCYENFQNFCKEATSITWKKEGNNYACMLSFPRSPHLTTTNILYIVEGSYKETIDFLSAITNRCGEDSPYVINSDDPSVSVKENHILSEDENESGAVRAPMMPPIVCNRAEYSHPLCFGRSTTVSSASESSALNFVYGRRKLNSVTFLSGHAPAMPKRSGDEYPSLISYDDPSAARKKQRRFSQHEHGTASMFVLQYTTERVPHALQVYKGVLSY